MNNQPRETLLYIIQTYGRQICDDPRRCEGLLLDLAGQHRREVKVLIAALQERAAADLMRVSDSIPVSMLLAQLTTRLRDNVAMAEDAARWVVESWALALGVISEADPLTSSGSTGSVIGTSQVGAATPPAPSQPDVAHTAHTLVVAKIGGAHYRTISEAIANAEPGTRIIVKPGFYVEGLTIDKPLEIVGDGPIEDIVVEARASDCVLMKTDYAVVRNMTLRNRSGAAGNQYFGVDIQQGQLVLEGCDITSDSLACVAIHKTGTNPIVRRCRVHNGKQSGIFVYAKGGGTIEDCDLYDNNSENISISSGGNPTIRRCSIYDGKACGVRVYSEGKGTIEDCDIYTNSLSCVNIDRGSNPTVRRCKLHDSEKGGSLLVYKNGLGLVEECDIYGNAFSGVGIRENGNLTVRLCKIHANKSAGVRIYTNGNGTIEDCNIHTNANRGISVETESSATIRKCQVNNNRTWGVAITERSTAAVEDCDLTGNPSGAIYVAKGCQVQRVRNKE